MSISISGNGTFTGANSDYSFDQSVGIAGTLTYEDVTNIDSVGVITARQGLDTPTDLLLRTGGTEKARIDSAGNFGVGETSPDLKFHVKETINVAYSADNATDDANNLLKLENPSTTANAFAGMAFRTGSGADMYFGVIQQSVNAGDFYFANQNSPNKELMRITSSGRVGIGVSAPSAGKLVVTDSSNGGFGGSIVLENSNNSDTDKVGIAFRPNGSATTAIGSYGESRIIGEYDSGSTNGANNLQFWTHAGNGTVAERMRIDSSGRVVIGDSTAFTDAQLTLAAPTEVALGFKRSGSGKFDAGIKVFDGHMTFLNGSDQASVGALAERMRIDSSGKVFIGKTASGIGYDGVEIQQNGFMALTQPGNGNSAISINMRYGAGTQYPFYFYYNGALVGNINVTSTSTSYVTSSDYRLKENVIDITGAINRVKQLQPKRFNFIASPDTIVDGFLAHEAQTVVPEAVTGTKDEVDDDGNAVMQGIDQSKLVPLLTAAIKELITEVETLKAKVQVLEGS